MLAFITCPNGNSVICSGSYPNASQSDLLSRTPGSSATGGPVRFLILIMSVLPPTPTPVTDASTAFHTFLLLLR